MASSLLRQVLTGLAAALPDTPDSLTLAEALWLAPRLPAPPDPPPLLGETPERASPPPLPEAGIEDPGPAGEATVEPAHDQREEVAIPDTDAGAKPEPPPPPVPVPPLAAPLLPRAALPSEDEADALRRLLPVWLEDPPLLADSLALLRALAPLRAELVEGARLRLDEDATVEAYVASCDAAGRGGCWQPVWAPIPEPRYELVLLIDGAPAMAIWHRLVADLQRALSSCAVVSQLRLVRLAPDGTVSPRQRRWCKPHPEGRRLLLLLSDCCGDAWWTGAMAERLAAWSPVASRALLQVLPGWMWPRTALGVGDALVLRNAGTATQERLRVERQRWLSEKPAWLRGAATGTVVPVLRCEPEGVAAWSWLLTGRPRQRCAGVRLPMPGDLAPGSPAEGAGLARESEDGDLEEAAPVPETELERLEYFETTASAKARRLLRLLAAAPVLTLPVIRLVRQALLSDDRTPLATAEVLLGGVVQLREGPGDPKEEPTAPEAWQFTMAPEVRERLLGAVDALDAVTVFNAVSRLVEERWNRFMPRGSFRAFLTDPYQQAPPELAGLEGFASVAAQVLERLGGDYAAMARQLSDGARKRVVEPWPAEEFVFEEAEVATGTVLPEAFPPIESVAAQTACLEEVELTPFYFDTATIEPTPRFGLRVLGQSMRQPSISRITGTGWSFLQPLGEGSGKAEGETPALAIVKIPAGRFTMVSPRGEQERRLSEGPQHEVELASFFMSQTPITQAQWRAVAGWEPPEGGRWERTLKPNPSRFQSKRRADSEKAQGPHDDSGSMLLERFALLEGEENSDQRPVEQVSWEDAMEFCNRLSQRTGLTYTLPSEAQWEYACRAGTTTPFAFGETLTTELANYRGISTYANGPKGMYRKQTTPVALFPANAWGLHDMHGNVWEWCLDAWHASYEGAPEDGRAWMERGTGKEKGEKEQEKLSDLRRLLRGGSWSAFPGDCRSAYRIHHSPGYASIFVGFRVVCLPQDPSLNP